MMKKIFGYELKRFLLNKFFFGILAVTLVYGWQVLRGDVILGIAYTAPFSPWSFGYYLAKMLPLLLIALLFFLSFLFSAGEQRVRVLTESTPVDPARYLLVRCLAMVLGYGVLCAAVAAEGCVFYYRLFGLAALGAFVLPAILTLAAPMVFLIGLGLFLGNKNSSLLYVLMALSLFYCALPLPYWLELSGVRFFSEYPLSLGVLDPGFYTPVSVALGRAGYLAAGVVLFYFGGWKRAGGKLSRKM